MHISVPAEAYWGGVRERRWLVFKGIKKNVERTLRYLRN